MSADLEPIFVSVAKAAEMLNLADWSIHQLIKDGDLDGRKHGRRRLITLVSVREYAANLPTERPVA